MPRGKYVNHKGRSRKFTAPEELQNETSSEEETSGDENEEGAAGTSSVPHTKTKPKGKEATNDSSSEEDSDEDERDSKKGVAGLIEIENPNRAVKKTTQKVANISLSNEGGEVKSGSKPELSRREREQIEKQKQRQRYEKLHAEGKTTEAKSDLARLAIIRQQRAEAAAKREAEKKALETKKPGNKA